MSTAFANPALANRALANPVLGKAAVVNPSRHGADTGTAATTRLRLTRRGRAVITMLTAVPLIVGAAAFALNGGGALASGHAADASFGHVTVSSGQSLWQIAERVAPSADPRDVVAAIVDLNQLPNSTVMPGERLAIPSQYGH